ncbi:pirin family protein [Denitratisoma oestradiolicum]|uniref:Putative Quercetin 2,3-dioxygenase n=1 Tax=Denitratisoma oestradiolicum TaxID=311182 RepID=A0A6S6XN33_9PROT|nr:pirin family protein [Denitratisoma oestradiolicum]TWO80912.1 quercetin 2,3-dioxygenase [Denitratisoma oestradiolicum]CAB1367321.1 putative Quercetin 2,3-dioxygenase [Denitratisoma oestradiolicum]
MTTRILQRIIPSIPVSDGAGVRLRRSLGQSREQRLDPFLMLDEFSSDNPEDYIAGFPAHPHRGFETVTYMLEGHFLHEDHLGHQGHLQSGGAQWMTAGRGIIHSEMPQQDSGRLHGFQFWINLPAREKMKPASYRDIQPEEIPRVAIEGGEVRIVAGSFESQGLSVAGPIQGLSTSPSFLDVRLPAGGRFAHKLPEAHSAFLYPYAGSLLVGAPEQQRPLSMGQAGVLSAGTWLAVVAGEAGAGFLLLAARPLGEPVAQYGPFVMNTREEVEQAIADYQAGQLV